MFAAVTVLAGGLVAVEVYVLSPGMRAGSVGVLERAGAWDRLAGMLDDDDPDVRAAASDALLRNGPAAIPALTRGLDRLPDRGRAFAAFTLGRIGPNARAALPALRRHMTEDAAAEVREAAAVAAGRVGRDDAAAVNEFLRMLEAGSTVERLAAARAAPELADSDRRRAVPLLAALLAHPDAEARKEAVEALGAIGADARPAVPVLIQATTDPVREVRAEAAEALEHLLLSPGGLDPDTVARVTAALAGARAGPPPAGRP
ncbi:MAG: HEAT repeat domain-containing protein [Gemmataceae bacterium]